MNAELSETSHILTARPASALGGRVRAPGDKSMSHRALILGAMATGVTEIEGLLEGDDILATARAVAAFGAGVKRLGSSHWRITGLGGFRTPDEVIEKRTYFRYCAQGPLELTE